MKLILDQNLSPRLVVRLFDVFPNLAHVSTLGLDRATDSVIWSYARKHGCVLVSKDADFADLGTLRGFPPKVVWLRLGNCSTAEIETLLRRHREVIKEFEIDPSSGILALG